MSGKVYFLGAGPGDPELLTRKAWSILSVADVLLHDALVAPEIVALAPASAMICDVGKRCGKRSIQQGEIHRRLIEYARPGRTVVRLQGGDPLIFGRAGEEIAALRAAGVDFEIVPGVTAASAAAAVAQIALTDRRHASKVIFLSAHRRENGPSEFHPNPGGKKDWAAIPAAGVTLAIYMPGTDYARIADDLRDAGFAGDTPCVIVSQVSMPQQTILRANLARLAEARAVPAPALLIVGQVAEEVIDCDEVATTDPVETVT